MTSTSSPVPAAARTPGSSVDGETGLTRIVYFLPQDESLRLEYEQAIVRAAQTAQSWYAGQLGGRTFRLASPVVQICRGDQPAAWYSTQSWSRVHSAVAACNPEFKYDDPVNRWVVYAQVRHQCGAPQPLGAALRGVTIVPVQDLQGVAGERDIVDDCGAPALYKGPEGINRWIGGLAHELGHVFGLPHPPGCEAGSAECERNALMWGGYAAFPNTALRAAERQQLLGSPFMFDLAAR